MVTRTRTLLVAALGLGSAVIVTRPARAAYTPAVIPSAYVHPTAKLVGASDCDNCATVIALPWAFPYFGRTFTQVAVSSNGTLTFGSNTAAPSANLPLAPTGTTWDVATAATGALPGPSIAVLWDDWNLALGGDIYTGASGGAFVIEWAGAFHAGQTAGTGSSFEVKLFPDGRIEMHHGALGSGNPSWDNAMSSTIGIQEDVDTVAQEWVYNRALTPNTARSLTRPGAAALYVSAKDGFFSPALPRPNLTFRQGGQCWTRCAGENQTCGGGGWRTVRFGANATFTTKLVNGPVACTTATFGDPAPGQVKACDAGPALPTTTSWSACSDEGGVCDVQGLREVRFGAGTAWTSRVVDAPVACTNATFGDPAPGVVKRCELGPAAPGTLLETVTSSREWNVAAATCAATAGDAYAVADGFTLASFGAQGGWASDDTTPRTLADVNGDGKADVVGFGADGAYVALSTGTALGAATRWTASFGSAGWPDQRTTPRVLADVNGDGRADVVGFGTDGTYVALSTGAAFGAASKWTTEFGTNGGWTDQASFPRYVVDVNKDGKLDLVGFGTSCPAVALSTGAAFAAATCWGAGFGSTAGWATLSTTGAAITPRALADVNADGKPDVVGFATDGVYVALNSGTAFGAAARWIANFGASSGAGGWTDQELFPRQLADVNGDGRLDVVGFGAACPYVALSTGAGFGTSACWTSGFGTTAGWSSQRAYPRQVRDIDGDGRADVVGFAAACVTVARSSGAAFAAGACAVNGFGTSSGWATTTSHPRQLADLDGDGRVEVVGFANAGVQVAAPVAVAAASLSGAAAFGGDSRGFEVATIPLSPITDVVHGTYRFIRRADFTPAQVAQPTFSVTYGDGVPRTSRLSYFAAGALDKTVVIIPGFDPLNEMSSAQLLVMMGDLARTAFAEGRDVAVGRFADGNQRLAWFTSEVATWIGDAYTRQGGKKVQVAGVSMGGVVTRAAVDANVGAIQSKLLAWYSIDGPQTGANLGRANQGIQDLILCNKSPNDPQYRQLFSNAAADLMNSRATTCACSWEPENSTCGSTSAYHDAYYGSIGWPTAVPRYAVAFGDANATDGYAKQGGGTLYDFTYTGWLCSEDQDWAGGQRDCNAGSKYVTAAMVNTDQDASACGTFQLRLNYTPSFINVDSALGVTTALSSEAADGACAASYPALAPTQWTGYATNDYNEFHTVMSTSLKNSVMAWLRANAP